MISSLTSIRTGMHEPQSPAPPTGHESPHDAHDSGWLGQVPPPAPPSAEPCPPANEPEPYAIPQLAPEPWKYDEPLYPHDPTLFG